MIKRTQYASLFFVTRCKAHFVSSTMKKREKEANRHFLVYGCFIRAVVECLVSCRNWGDLTAIHSFSHTYTTQNTNKQTNSCSVRLFICFPFFAYHSYWNRVKTESKTNNNIEKKFRISFWVGNEFQAQRLPEAVQQMNGWMNGRV